MPSFLCQQECKHDSTDECGDGGDERRSRIQGRRGDAGKDVDVRTGRRGRRRSGIAAGGTIARRSCRVAARSRRRGVVDEREIGTAESGGVEEMDDDGSIAEEGTDALFGGCIQVEVSERTPDVRGWR